MPSSPNPQPPSKADEIVAQFLSTARSSSNRQPENMIRLDSIKDIPSNAREIIARHLREKAQELVGRFGGTASVEAILERFSQELRGIYVKFVQERDKKYIFVSREIAKELGYKSRAELTPKAEAELEAPAPRKSKEEKRAEQLDIIRDNIDKADLVLGLCIVAWHMPEADRKKLFNGEVKTEKLVTRKIKGEDQLCLHNERKYLSSTLGTASKLATNEDNFPASFSNIQRNLKTANTPYTFTLPLDPEKLNAPIPSFDEMLQFQRDLLHQALNEGWAQEKKKGGTGVG